MQDFNYKYNNKKANKKGMKSMNFKEELQSYQLVINNELQKLQDQISKEKSNYLSILFDKFT